MERPQAFRHPEINFSKPFQFQQIFLDIQPLGVAGQAAICANDPVAGHHDAQRDVFMDVPVGTSVEELIERAGGIDGVYGEIIMGGPFTGKATTFDAPITPS